MGTINKGILGGFSGKVGSVVGGNWKGIDYMRSNGTRRNNTPSEKQLMQQLKFATTMRFVQPMAGLLALTFNDYAIHKTGINSAFAYTIKNAIAGTYPAFSIDYSKALVSRGDLPNALGPSVVSGAGSILTFSWTDNSGVGTAKPTDKVVIVAFCSDLKQAIYSTSAAMRSDLTADLNLLPFAGLKAQTWIGFISDNDQHVATSIFTGEVTVS